MPNGLTDTEIHVHHWARGGCWCGARRCEFRLLAAMEGWRKPEPVHGEVGSFEDTLIECNNRAMPNGRCLFHGGEQDSETTH